jgi:hypothetical protein
MLERTPTFASYPELNNSAVGAWWKVATNFSSSSAYAEFPSNSREPPLAKGNEGGVLFRRERNRSRYADDVDSERKSLEEKSTAVRGRTVNLRREDLASRCANAAENDSTRVGGEDCRHEDNGFCGVILDIFYKRTDKRFK